jgi:hypothetical protein
MSVESFDPASLAQSLDNQTIDALCALAPDGDQCELSAEDVARYAFAIKHSGWQERSATLEEEQVRDLIRLFTLGEECYPQWAAGSKSPVIALVRELKNRGIDSRELTRWIKAHTSNKFLPHGSLMDRL